MIGNVTANAASALFPGEQALRALNHGAIDAAMQHAGGSLAATNQLDGHARRRLGEAGVFPSWRMVAIKATAENLLGVTSRLQDETGVCLRVRTRTTDL